MIYKITSIRAHCKSKDDDDQWAIQHGTLFTKCSHLQSQHLWWFEADLVSSAQWPVHRWLSHLKFPCARVFTDRSTGFHKTTSGLTELYDGRFLCSQPPTSRLSGKQKFAKIQCKAAMPNKMIDFNIWKLEDRNNYTAVRVLYTHRTQQSKHRAQGLDCANRALPGMRL